MPPFKNFFSRNGAAETPEESNRRNLQHNASSAAVSIRSQEEPAEYKMSVVNDSGIYLPPSPPEKKSFWPRRAPSSTSNHRAMLSENEPFSISRESFDSYRRSFDISARSPVIQPESATGRASLDSRHPRLGAPRASFNRPSFERPPSEEDERFEEVGLNDDPRPKKKSFFSRFGDSSNNTDSSAASSEKGAASTGNSNHNFHIPGRKRGQSGQGAELGDMSQAKSPPGESENGAD